MLIPRRIMADHGLSVAIDDVWRVWIDLYSEATQLPPFRTLREIQGQILPHVLRRFGVGADAAPYVDLFFQVTTQEIGRASRRERGLGGLMRRALMSR